MSLPLPPRFQHLSPMTPEALSSAVASLPINLNQPPPAYELVVDPSAPIPNLRNPYDPVTEEEKDDTDDEEMDDYDDDEEDGEDGDGEGRKQKEDSEVTINAAIQIRGHGNIISMPPMEGARVVGVLMGLLGGGSVTPPPASQPFPGSFPEMAAASSNLPENPHSTSNPTPSTPAPTQIRRTFRLKKPSRRITITLNCGATVIGDRNIVGPGLGEIARQMSAGRQTQTATPTATLIPTPMPMPMQGMGQAPQGWAPVSMAQQAPTPPVSRTSSLGGETSRSSAKRKGDEDGNGAGSPRKKSK